MEKYVGERIRKARNAKKMSQEDLAEIVDVRRQTIGEYERGGDIPLSMLEKIAKVLDVDMTTFIMKEQYEDKLDNKIDTKLITKRPETQTDLVKIRTKKVPLLSREAVACCGKGNHLAEVVMETERTISVPEDSLGSVFDDMNPVFAMRVEGDSMEGAGIGNGAIIIVNPAEEVQTGNIALVRVDDALMVKRVLWKRDGSFELHSDGETKSIFTFSREDLNTGWVKFCGKVVAKYESL